MRRWLMLGNDDSRATRVLLHKTLQPVQPRSVLSVKAHTTDMLTASEEQLKVVILVFICHRASKKGTVDAEYEYPLVQKFSINLTS